MSTSIHHGYRLTEGTEICDFLREVRTTMDPLRDRADARVLLARAVTDHDMAAVLGLPSAKRTPECAPWTVAVRDHQREQARLAVVNRGSILYDPNRFDLSIGWDEPSRRDLVLLYTEDQAMREAWERLPAVEDFHYQNATDRPATITPRAWDSRRRAWLRMIPFGAVPADRMDTFHLRTENHMAQAVTTWSPTANADHFEGLLATEFTIENRAEALAERLLSDAVNVGDFDDLITHWFTFSREMRASQERTDLAEAVRERLTPLTQTDLKTPPPSQPDSEWIETLRQTAEEASTAVLVRALDSARSA